MRNAIPPIGLFGKLPSHPDFIRLNAGSPLARAIDQWFQEGMSSLRLQVGDGWESVFDRAVPVFFVYRDRDASSALVGVSRPSRDQTGRRYPFSIFSHVQLGRNGKEFHVLPMAYARFLKAARRMLETDCADGIDNAKAARVMNLASTLPQNLVEFETKFNHFVGQTTMESFWQTLFPEFHDQRKYLVIKNLFSALVPRRGQDSSRFTFSLHLPTAAGMDAVVEQIGVWCSLCRGALGGKGLEQASVFWHADAAPPARGCYLSSTDADERDQSVRPGMGGWIPAVRGFAGRGEHEHRARRFG